jgi:hypothetical protein
VDLGYDGLGYGLDDLHEPAADVEDAPVSLGVPADHLGEVVAGAEGRALAAQDHDGGVPLPADGNKAVDQLQHVVF